jgi:hypothetical protein
MMYRVVHSFPGAQTSRVVRPSQGVRVERRFGGIVGGVSVVGCSGLLGGVVHPRCAFGIVGGLFR